MNKISINDVDKSLKTYIENFIFPQYSKNDEGHQLKHINEVIERSFELSPLKLNPNIIFTVASFHDIGSYISRKNHEIESAKIMMKDEFLKNFFSQKELIIIKEAIEDHRASLNRMPRSIYGKLISSADRSTNLDDFILRAYKAVIKSRSLVNNGIPSNRNFTHEEIIEAIYNHLVEKFGISGYAKMYFIDEKYKEFINDVNFLINNKEEFYKREEKIFTRSLN